MEHKLKGTLSPVKTLKGALSIKKVYEEKYTGPYIVTPTRSEQVLPTEGKTLGQDIIVNPIPSNYGLITWDGAILTVS